MVQARSAKWERAGVVGEEGGRCLDRETGGRKGWAGGCAGKRRKDRSGARQQGPTRRGASRRATAAHARNGWSAEWCVPYARIGIAAHCTAAAPSAHVAHARRSAQPSTPTPSAPPASPTTPALSHLALRACTIASASPTSRTSSCAACADATASCSTAVPNANAHEDDARSGRVHARKTRAAMRARAQRSRPGGRRAPCTRAPSRAARGACAAAWSSRSAPAPGEHGKARRVGRSRWAPRAGWVQ